MRKGSKYSHEYDCTQSSSTDYSKGSFPTEILDFPHSLFEVRVIGMFEENYTLVNKL